MKGIKLFFTALVLILASVASYAQNVKVSGVVSDESGLPVVGATVMVEGTSNGTSTDVDGKYTLTVPSKSNLVVTMVGYETVTVAVNGQSTINFSIKEDTTFLDEVVVVGYGSAKKVGSIVGSITTVKSDIVKNAPSSSALDQLQGQVAGLAVLTTGGVAGDNNVSMTLHGVGSLGAGSTPLFIIDGVPSSSGMIQSLNPNDILSVSVLKDASATSIYGSRAANGVVYVTTKSGDYQTKARVSVRSQYGISTLANDRVYKGMMSSDELKDFWIRSGIKSAAAVQSTYGKFTGNTQWYKVMQQLNNPQYQNDVTLEGGGSKVAYMISASQFHQRGTAPGNYYDRYTLRSNVQGHPYNWLKVGVNMNISVEENQQNGNWGNSSNVSNYTSGGLSFLLLPFYNYIDSETGKPYEVKYEGGTITNPYYYMKSYPRVVDYYSLVGSAYAEIEPFKNFKIRSQAGTNASLSYSDSKNLPSSQLTSTGSRGLSMGLSFNTTITNTAEYNFNINNDHEFSFLLGQEYVDYASKGFNASSTGQTDDRILTLGAGTDTSRKVGESRSQYRFNSFFGHAEYTFAQKYNLDLTVRDDASSRFGKNNRHAQFWSVGALWRAKKENFLKNVNWLNDLRVKASYGTQGNASIGNYTHLGTISSTTNYQGANSWQVSQPANPSLTWENQALLTVGVAGRAFNVVDFEVEFYNRNTTSMLMDVPVPYSTGFDGMTSNVGSLNNKGIDLTLGFDVLKSRDYYLRVNTTFNYNKQTITELFQGRERWEIANTGLAYVVGKPVMYYAPIFAGIDPTDGAPTWYLPSDNIDETTMDPERITKRYDEDSLTQNTGKMRYAPINGGFGIQAGWKGFSVAADFSYVLGKTLVNNDMYFYANPANFATMNTHKMVSNYWTPENTDAKWPNWKAGHIMQFDTHLYENASFLRLKSLQVAYSLPSSVLNWQKLFSGVKFTFTGRNLFTVTKYTGIDPEVDSNLTYGKLGSSKQLLGGIEITF